MTSGALIIAGAILLHASWTIHPHTRNDTDVAVPFLTGLFFIILGLVVWIA